VSDTPRKKKKVDYEALHSGLMHIPHMKVDIARDLIDLGLREIHELQGRSPEILWNDLQRLRDTPPPDRLSWFRMAVYYAETTDPDPSKMYPHAWDY